MQRILTVPAELLQRQMSLVLEAWGMPKEDAAVTADVLTHADLMGIDSHGITLLPLYDELIHSGRLEPKAQTRIERSFGATAVINGGGGLGQVPSVRAMDLAMEKARAFGIGAVGVRDSNHYGAAGFYALRAAQAGLIGLSTSAVYKASIVPIFGREPRLGTNPLAFAAPGRRNKPFLLDMATSTIAIGKLKLAAREGKSLREGWALDRDGRPQHDPERALVDRLMTPLGGSRAMGGHKGYGLAAMVEVLSTLLSGASFAPLRDPQADRFDVGHFHMAIHPDVFREAGEFADDLDRFIDCLHATSPADADQPVLVPGDPEHGTFERRSREGIPVPASMVQSVADIARKCGAEFLLSSELEE
ncbi:Ldh family oxidoreductase [Microvirga makkahensis]|uniref:Ldh family oxidoreductase n=1 Tax=Microvirga makkahensis TaxID=1128670 RepID=A0A7X3MVY0_9HYPH|nr:Ldh family oxidoreductase [Microvirga makkahensis]